MADDKEILIEIKVDSDQAKKDVTSLTGAIEGTKQATKELESENKRLVNSGKKNSKQYKENAELIAINKNELSKLNVQRKRAINTAQAQKGSLTGLRNELAKLTDARNRDLVVGSKSFNDANKNIASLNNQIKATEAAGGDFRRNVGNYASGADNLAGSVSKISPALGGMATQMISVTRAALAFIATPLGLILAGIAAAVALVVSYFKRTEEGGDKLAVGMAFLGGVLESLLDVVAGLGKLLFDVFVNGFNFIVNNFKITGLALKEVILGINVAWQKVFGSVEDYEKAQKELSKNTAEIIKLGKEQVEIVKETSKAIVEDTNAIIDNVSATGDKIKQTVEQQRLENALNKTRRETTVSSAEANRQVFEGLKLAKDETKSFEERRKGLEEASAGETKLAENRLKIAIQERDIIKGRDAINDSNTEALQEVADAEAKVIEAQTASLRVQTKIQASRITLLNQEESANNAKKKQAEKDAADDQKLLDDKLARETKNTEDLKTLELQKEIDKGGTPQEKANAEIAALDFKHDQEITKIKEKLSEETQLSLDQLNEQLANGTLQFASLEEENYSHAQAIIKINEDTENAINSKKEETAKNEEERIKKEASLRKQLAGQTLNTLSTVFRTAGMLAANNFKLQKAFAIAEAVVNTAKGVSQALGSAPPPLSFVTAAAVGVAGAIQVANIAKTTPNTGGAGNVSIPSLGSVDTSQATADTSQADNAQSQSELLANALNNQGLQVSVTEINEVQNRVQVTDENAQI